MVTKIVEVIFDFVLLAVILVSKIVEVLVDFVLLAVILVSSSAATGGGFVELDQGPSLHQTTVDSCKTPGYQCSDDCTKIQLCVSTGASFQLVQVEDCGQGYCDKEQHTCSDTQTTCRVKVNFTCSEAGIFPDLYDCTVFHICADGGVEIESGTCDTGYAYDALTSACDLKVADVPRVCTDGPVPACVEEGQTGALDSNPSIYYVCTDDNTLLYRCSHGQYDPSLFSCKDSTPTSNTTTPTPTPVTCDLAGVSIVDPDSCNGYYLCNLLLEPIHEECPAGNFFSPLLHLCLPGSCEDGAGTTTTPADTKCEKVGMSSDPASCTGYYFCDASLRLVHRQCDTGTYFNKSLSLCAPGTCQD
uniref:Chitin-binding type-2 domain-containing protein n=1 Tax=Timema tahoe TaxID=61484 RepID=A0A7R9ITJ3_9NEOP|nr:unnamed protein product [Timema tahoe]